MDINDQIYVSLIVFLVLAQPVKEQQFVECATDIKVFYCAVLKNELSLVAQFSLELVFAASICHPEAVRGNSLVLPVWEVQASRNNRSGRSIRFNLATSTNLCSENQSAILPVQAKAAIRELLPGGLREAISKVRSSVAYAISAIAHWDWPEAWPQLFTLLMEMLVSGDINAVHGAMRVLTGVGNMNTHSTNPPLYTIFSNFMLTLEVVRSLMFETSFSNNMLDLCRIYSGGDGHTDAIGGSSNLTWNVQDLYYGWGITTNPACCFVVHCIFYHLRFWLYRFSQSLATQILKFLISPLLVGGLAHSALFQVYSIRTRSRAVEIFTTCANLICAIEELEKVRWWQNTPWSVHHSYQYCSKTITLNPYWRKYLIDPVLNKWLSQISSERIWRSYERGVF